MTVENRKKYIRILRDNGFNCFPINPKSEKQADSKYDGAATKTDQEILDSENYGYMARAGKGNCIVDFDSKIYESKLLEIAKKYMVIKTGQGFHLPVISLTDDMTKVELFDYSKQDKKIIEIQGTKHYVMGIGSEIYHLKLEKDVEYVNIGTDVILNQNSSSETFVDQVCYKFSVKGKKKSDSAHYEMRQRFLDGKPPTKSTSNDYFYNAAIQCLTDELTETQAQEKIKRVYDKWVNSPTFSGRSWDNILAKIKDGYENGTPLKVGRNKKSDNDFDRTAIALEINDSRKLYSDKDNESQAIIFENKNGFLEPVNSILRKELQKQYPQAQKGDIDEIRSKLYGLAEELPERNKDLIVFRNGTYSFKEGGFVKTDDIAYTGFKDYDYIENPNPEIFLDVMFGNIKPDDIERLKAGLSHILKPVFNPRLSVIQGFSGVGKSTGISIIVKLLGKQYAMITELERFLKDPATRADTKGKLFLVIQELPEIWTDVNKMKIILGEQKISGRKNFQDHEDWDNHLKVFSSANRLPKVPIKDENPMFSRRLSLVRNTKEKAYPEDPTFEDSIIEKEGSEILSYLVNLSKENFSYEIKETVEREWKKIANPEDEIVEKYYTEDLNSSDITIYSLIKTFKNDFNIKLSKKEIEIAFSDYNVFGGYVKNCARIEPKITLKTEEQTQL